jgi:hypothetical protein
MTEERDVEIFEFGLDGEEIDELIEKLEILKKSKASVTFDIDEENEFIIHYDEGEEIEEEEEDSLESKREDLGKENEENKREENIGEESNLELNKEETSIEVPKLPERGGE